MSIIIAMALSNFGLLMVILAIFFILLHRFFNKKSVLVEILYRWTTLLPLGMTAFYVSAAHAFFPHFTAAIIGWQSSPFQFEIAMANLAFGMIAVLSFKASIGFRLANVIANTCWLWGDAVGHIYQMVMYQNVTIGNARSWLWMDICIPLLLIICIIKLRKAEYKRC